jgi:hypothetical protein
MVYPEYFTEEDIIQFEQEYNQYLDLADPYSLANIDVKAEKQQKIAENLDTVPAF